jgi:hypothetical protein
VWIVVPEAMEVAATRTGSPSVEPERTPVEIEATAVLRGGAHRS